MRTLSILAPAFVAIPLLLACTRTDVPRASADSPTRSAAPASDTSAASRPSAPADAWTVTPAGIGAIRVGLDTTDLRRIGGEFTVPKASAECSYVRPALAPRGVLVMLAHGRVVRVDVDSAGVRSDAGIAVGDSVSRVVAAYGTRVTATPHKYLRGGQYLNVHPTAAEDSTFRLVFETDSGRVTRFRSGRLPEVAWVERCG